MRQVYLAKESVGQYEWKEKNMVWLNMFKISGTIKWAKLQWLVYPSQTGTDNMKNRMPESSGHLSNEAGNIWQVNLMGLK
jgi:hypothetical protein